MTFVTHGSNLYPDQKLELWLRVAIDNKEEREKITKLFLGIFGHFVEKTTTNIKFNDYYFTVQLKTPLYKSLPSRYSILYIPKVVKFCIKNQKDYTEVHFSDDPLHTLTEIKTIYLFWKHSWRWTIFSIVNKQFNFLSQYTYGVILPRLGGYGTSHFVNVKEMLLNVSENPSKSSTWNIFKRSV